MNVSGAATAIARYLASGNLAAAEIVARAALRDPAGDHGAALLGLAEIAAAVGRQDRRLLYLDALAAPYRDGCRPLMPEGLVDLAAFAPDEARGLLVVNSRGQGFWSEVSHVVGCYLLAWLAGRRLVTNWSASSLFHGDADPSRDCFTDFFEPIDGAEAAAERLAALLPAADLERCRRENFPAYGCGSIAQVLQSTAAISSAADFISPQAVLHWIIPDVAPSQEELANGLAAAYRRVARPRAAMAAEAERFVAATFGAEPFDACHLRGTDKAQESAGAAAATRAIVEQASALPGGRRLFLLCDDERLVEAMRDRLGERLVLRSDVLRSTGPVGVHFEGRLVEGRLVGDEHGGGRDGRRLGAEVLVDVLVAARSRVFVGSGQSNVAAAVALLRHGELSPHCHLHGANMLLQPKNWCAVVW